MYVKILFNIEYNIVGGFFMEIRTFYLFSSNIEKAGLTEQFFNQILQITYTF